MDSNETISKLSEFLEKVPQIDLRHIELLSNHTGIFQHATFNIPNYHHGYCLDDNSRALLLLLMATDIEPILLENRLIPIYLSYIYYAQNKDGSFRNFMSYDLKFLEENGSDDSLGRTVWAVGYLLSQPKFSKYHAITKEIFDQGSKHIEKIKSVRAIAYCVLGIAFFLENKPNDNHYLRLLENLIGFLKAEYKSANGPDWQWYEEIISYDNAIIPFSLLKAGKILGDSDLVNIGLESFSFLDKIYFKNGYLSPVGNEDWFKKGESSSDFGQQPIEVLSILLLYDEATHYNTSIHCEEKIYLAFLWYLGVNIKKESLFDFNNMACYDGLESYGCNKNQGAESNIAFWTSYVIIKKYFNSI